MNTTTSERTCVACARKEPATLTRCSVCGAMLPPVVTEELPMPNVADRENKGPVVGAAAMEFTLVNEQEEPSHAERLVRFLGIAAALLVALVALGVWELFHFDIMGVNRLLSLSITVGVIAAFVVPVVVISKRWLAFVVEDRGPRALVAAGMGMFVFAGASVTFATYSVLMGVNVLGAAPVVPMPCVVSVPRGPMPMRARGDGDAHRDVTCKMTDGTILNGTIPNTRTARVGASVMVPLRKGLLDVWMVQGPAELIAGQNDEERSDFPLPGGNDGLEHPRFEHEER